MLNQEISAAYNYHESTKHSVWSVQRNRHYLDWDNKPELCKLYPDLEPIPLPVDLLVTGVPAAHAVLAGASQSKAETVPSIEQVAYLLYYSAGITKKLIHPQGQVYFRAAASAGALYPVEIYLACSDLPGLEAGIYHFSPREFALHFLRQGDWRTHLVHGSGDEPSVRAAPLILIFTGVTWRSAWKYQARAYRYHFWDNGTLLANTLAACAVHRLPARLIMGFVDRAVNHLLGIDGQEEKSLCLLPVGRWSEPLPERPVNAAEPAPLHLRVAPQSPDPLVYRAIEQIHAASTLHSADEVTAWRGALSSRVENPPQGQLFPLEPLTEREARGRSLEDTLLWRGSARRFQRKAISFSELSLMLHAAQRSFPSDWLNSDGSFLNDLYLNVHAVDGLPAGAYRFRRHYGALEQLKTGNFRQESAHLCLGQDLGGEASATVFFLADLDAILNRYGNRGYRLAQMEAGILGGRIYLMAYALQRGASGLTFYDDDVIQFFSPQAAGMQTIFVTALGVPGRLGRRGGKITTVSPGEPIEED